MIKFSKMHGLGNDFMVIDSITQIVPLEKLSLAELSDRHTGVGFDQLLFIEKSNNADFSCRIFNADGSEAEQCGNGMRCIARFIQEKKLSSKKSLRIETKAGIIETFIHDFERIDVNMGVPQILPSCELMIEDRPIQLSTISMGNPHVILKVKSLNNFHFEVLGKKISNHERFPSGVNVGFMEVLDRDHICLKTYERGSGLTLACGSNACAAVASGIVTNLLNEKVTVELEKGSLTVTWKGKDRPLVLTGPTMHVFDGVF